MFEVLLQAWGQANSYAKFILVLGLALPVGSTYLAYRFEKWDPKKKAQVGCHRTRAFEKTLY